MSTFLEIPGQWQKHETQIDVEGNRNKSEMRIADFEPWKLPKVFNWGRQTKHHIRTYE